MANEDVLYVHNTTRSRSTKTARLKGQRPRLTQRLAGGQITVKRGHPRRVTEAQLRAYWAQFKEAVCQGNIQLKDARGRVVDIFGQFPDGPPPERPPASPPPQFPLDSAHNDKNVQRLPLAGDLMTHNPTDASRGALPDLLKPKVDGSVEGTAPGATGGAAVLAGATGATGGVVTTIGATGSSAALGEGGAEDESSEDEDDAEESEDTEGAEDTVVVPPAEGAPTATTATAAPPKGGKKKKGGRR